MVTFTHRILCTSKLHMQAYAHIQMHADMCTHVHTCMARTQHDMHCTQTSTYAKISFLPSELWPALPTTPSDPWDLASSCPAWFGRKPITHGQQHFLTSARSSFLPVSQRMKLCAMGGGSTDAWLAHPILPAPQPLSPKSTFPP